jgi:D-alanyl-D-alanine carboxypeptidase
VLVDVGTGNVLAGYQERLRVRPASLTKVLTALIAVSYLPKNARVRGTKVSWNAYPNTVGIEVGVAWPLSEVLQSLLVLSANDAAYAIAQRVSGSLAAFAPVMERSAYQIGMQDSPTFHDPAGLDGTEGYGGGNLVSARDLAIAGRDLLRVPELARIVTEQSYRFVDPTGEVHWLPSLESYPGAIGVKTGFTDTAGDCLMAAATRNGRTMLAVVMNGYNPTATAIDLLNQGFATPVASEPATDRLPPPVLPSLPKPQTRASHFVVRTVAPTHKLSAASTRPSSRGVVRLRASAAAVASAVVHRQPRRGLAAVAGTWLGQILLVITGISALWAFAELLTENNLRRRHRKSTEPFSPGSSMLSNLNGGRRRREQLLASYKRHEKTSSRYGH